jgi:predicted AlkP superfamily phosphohydrolase/phosphomutase
VFERVFLLELSGPTIPFLRERAARLPRLRQFLEHGAWAELEGSLQPTAPNAFGVLYTGLGPGRTGLYDFFTFPAGGYERVPYSTSLLERETFFERLSRHGRRVGLLAAPLTHPLPEVNGFVVSDDEGIGDDYAAPPEVKSRLERMGYRVPFGASYAPGRERAFLDHAMRVLAGRREALRTLFADGNWQFGMLGLILYGELLHAFWHYYDRRHPRYRPLAADWGDTDPFLDALSGVDELLGDILDLVGPHGLVIVMGAWGHRLEHSRVHFNSVLEREGWLSFKRTPRSRLKHAVFRLGVTPAHAERVAHRLNLYRLFHYGLARGRRSAVRGAAFLSYDDVDWSRTRAVAMGYHGQVYLNVRGHRPLGTIAPGEYQAECQRLRALLAGLRDPRDGQPMVERVFTRDELYHGEELTDAPDLIVHLREGYSGDSGISGAGRIVSASPPNHSSDHSPRSAFLAFGEGVRPGEVSARLEDVAPTVLHALGVEPPAGLDGKVLPIFE